MPNNQPFNWWKFGVLAAIAAGLFLFGRTCGIKSVAKTTGRDTTIYRDTVIREYVPYAVNHYHDTTIYHTHTKYLRDTIPVPSRTDTTAILADYYATRFYSDTQALKRGVVLIEDSISRNRITRRKLTTTGTDTTIHIRDTFRVPRRLVGYVDIAGMGGRHDFGVSAGFSLKLPSDRVYGVGVSYLWNGKLMYYGRASIPIRLKR